ncbi:hypothetical protein HY994_06375 [Candidatus Micrarchaeota archaeon]|nr:hypothetical protein [Candidatus Micrarchaeota archaeon]
MKLIDPDRYVAQIAPRPIFLLHNPDDDVIPYSSAQFTYSQAGQVKGMAAFACPEPQLHGYCKEMDGKLKADLARIFG